MEPLRAIQDGLTLPQDIKNHAIVADSFSRVTSLATSLENPNMLLSGSRDKTLIVWNLTRDDQNYGYPKRSLHGHSHIVSDCVGSPRRGG